MKIIIEDYTPVWNDKFLAEKNRLTNSILEKNIFIEHIGSTSVKGLGAKPIIDIMVGLPDFKTAENHIKALQNIGYEYVSKHNSVLPLRRFFAKSNNGEKEIHIHMVGYQTKFWNRHLAFRNHLRENKEDRDRYFNLKVELAKKEWENGSEYANAKSEFILSIEKKLTY